jgi:hypothetical protein
MSLMNSFTRRAKHFAQQSRTRARYSKRFLRRAARQLHANAHMRGFRAQLTTARWSRRAFTHGNRLSATVAALLIFVAYVLIFPNNADGVKISEVSLTCAQVIGGALALILSLSIIPAQRAAEAFSPAVLKLYAQDRWLLGAFLVLTITTTGSVLIGTNFVTLNPYVAIGVQFALLGVSFDALRFFHGRTLDLLIPQTAVQLIIRECTKQLHKVTRTVDRLLRIQGLATTPATPDEVSRWMLFSASHVSKSLRFWIGQLDEIAHKLISRRDTSAVNDIVTAMGQLGKQYADARRTSLILMPDANFPLAGGTSDITDVLNPIYESMRVICEDAAKAPNELVVKHCIETLTGMTTHAMTIVHSADGWGKAPLAFGACYWTTLCSAIAVKAGMGDAALAAANGFQSILLKQSLDVNTSDLEAQCLESLYALATASYANPDGVWGFAAVKAMLLAAKHDIEVNGYSNTPTFETVLRYIRVMTPLEVAMYQAGQRVTVTFPPYDLSFEASVPALFEMVAHQVEPVEGHPLNSPFHDFLEAAEEIRNHYRELSNSDFGGTLLRKWVIDSLMAAARVHFALLLNPPAGTAPYLEDVDASLRWLISWVSQYFSKQCDRWASDAADSLACLGIRLLEIDRIESALQCGKTIAALASHSATLQREPYALADIQQRLETLARAADALKEPNAGTQLRAMIEKPASIADEEWPHFIEARDTRWSQLDENLERRRSHYRFRDDPVDELRRVLNQAKIKS